MKTKMGRDCLRIWGRVAAWLAPMVVPIGVIPLITVFLLLPKMDALFLQRQEESVKNVSHAVCWMLARYEQEERNGRLTHEEAQQQALSDLRGIRYGSEMKDYFWVSDVTPCVLMHPYRLDLEGREVGDLTDPDGKAIFREFVRVALTQGSGTVEYTWQWKDNLDRLERKVAFVTYFEPWKWVIGTGFYPCDLEVQTSTVRRVALLLSLGIAVLLSAGVILITYRMARTEGLRMSLEVESRRLKGAYEGLLDGLPCAVVQLDSDGIVVSMNSFGLSQFGLNADAVRGQKLASLVASDDADHEKQFECLLNDALEGICRAGSVEARYAGLDDSPFWITWFCSTSGKHRREGPSVLCIGVNTTAGRQAKDALGKEQELRNALIRGSMSYYISLGLDGRIIALNDSILKALGYEEREAMAQGFLSQILPAKDRAQFMTVVERLKSFPASPPIEWEGELCSRDCHLRSVRWRARTIPSPEGKPEYYLISGMDVTDQRREEEDAEVRREELIQLGKMESLGILVSGIAHEINNPNQYIMTNASLIEAIWEGARPIFDEYATAHGEFMLGGLKYSRVREEYPGFLSGIIDGVERIHETVEALKRFAKRPVVGLDDRISLNSMIRSATTLVSNLIKKSTREFRVEFDEDVPVIRGRFQELEQVVINLICNACELLPDKNCALSLVTRYDAHQKIAIVEVSAENAILPPSPTWDEPANATNRRRRGNDRLWFWVSAQIVRDHHGTLELSSRPGEGVVAVVKLPVCDTGDELPVTGMGMT